MKWSKPKHYKKNDTKRTKTQKILKKNGTITHKLHQNTKNKSSGASISPFFPLGLAHILLAKIGHLGFAKRGSQFPTIMYLFFLNVVK